MPTYDLGDGVGSVEKEEQAAITQEIALYRVDKRLALELDEEETK